MICPIRLGMTLKRPCITGNEIADQVGNDEKTVGHDGRKPVMMEKQSVMTGKQLSTTKSKTGNDEQ